MVLSIARDPNTRYGKPLTRLTGPKKTHEMAIIRASRDWRDPAPTAGVCHLGVKTLGAAGSESLFVSSGQAFG
jgi:hypothetical protein